MTEQAFDALLKRAACEAAALDYLPLAQEIDGQPLPPYSMKYLRWRKLFLHNPFGFAKRKTRPLWKKALQTAACLALAVSLSFGALLAVSPTVRAEFIKWCKEITQASDTFRFTGAQTGQILGNWRPTFVPEGYEEVGCTGISTVIVTYQNSNGKDIDFTYSVAQEGSLINVDNEDMDIYEYPMRDITLYIYESQLDRKYSNIIWVDEKSNVAFTLTSFEPIKVMIAMAESVSLSD